MILLSRLIKSGWTIPDKSENRVISIKTFKVHQEESGEPYTSIDAMKEREQIIEKAVTEADSIVAEANAYKESIEIQLQQEKLNWEQEKVLLTNQAQESGFEAGFHEGRNQGYNETQSLIDEAKQIIDKSKEDYFKKIESAEETILNLGLKVAERILGTQLKENEEVFLSIAKRALKEAREYREIQLHIHPRYYDFLIEQKDDLIRIFPKETELYIYPDSDLSEQSCIIESANGRIDASVDVQLEEIKAKLFEMLESE